MRATAGALIDGRYRLEAMIGAGGFGEVWQATHVVDGAEVRTVAIKLLDAGSDAGWLDEVRAVRDVVCDAVPTIFDAGVARDGGLAFIAMELLEGETLDARLDRGAIPWRRALVIAREVARALAACHRVGVVHCDLKPQNIFLAASGRVCVLDFGVAALGGKAARTAQPAPRRADPGADTRPLGPGGRAVEPVELAATDAVSADMMPAPSSAAEHERSQVVVGTPGYLPPEAYSGEGRTPAADAYALGVLLHRMITTRLPQRLGAELEREPASTPGVETLLRARAALATATIRGELAPLHDHAADVPAAIGGVIARLTAMRPADRPGATVEDELAEVAARPYGLPEPPYLGLEAFDVARAGFLAGREADIAQIATRLATRRAVVLAGPSGSGKSSLAVAGVAARVDEELLDGVDGWRVIIVRPGERLALRVAPDEAEVAAVAPARAVTTPVRLAARAVEQARSDGRAAARGAPVSTRPGVLGTVVVIDQLEEVLRLPDAERDAVCDAVAALCVGDRAVIASGRRFTGDDPVRVVATVRDDLFGRLAAIPALRRIPEDNLYVVRGVEPNAVPEIVVGPARAAGFALDDEAAVVAEASSLLAEDPGALPLVQFALTRWWERRDREARRLPAAAWRDIGGFAGALADAAGELHDRLDAAERDAMRRVLVAMFRPDGTRARLPERELVAAEVDRRVVDALLAGRLLRRAAADGDRPATLEVVHEALGARWPRLRSWLDETRVERELIHDARLDAERWRRAGRPADLLWRGARLAAVAGLRTRLGEADEMIDAALATEGGQRRQRRAWVAVGGGLVVAAVAAVVAWYGSDVARQRAERAQQAADVARADALGEAAINRELRAGAEAELRAAEIARAQAQAQARKMRDDATAQLRAADAARAAAEVQVVAAEEQRRKAEVAEARRVLAEADAARCPVTPPPTATP